MILMKDNKKEMKIIMMLSNTKQNQELDLFFFKSN